MTRRRARLPCLPVAQAKRFHFPRLRLPKLRGVQVDLDPKTALKAVPVLAAAVAELPAVREELRERLGKDLAPHVVAREAIGRFKEEAAKLGEQVEGTALDLARLGREVQVIGRCGQARARAR